MMIRNIKKLSITLFGILMALTLMLQNNSVAAAVFPLQNTSLLSAINTKSISNGETREEPYTIPNVTGTSLWFGNLSTNTFVRTRNEPSVRHLAGGKVEITVHQEGCGGLYTYLDGVHKGIPIETVEQVTTATRQYTVARYTIDYNSHIVDKDAPYTIFTSGIIQTNGTSGSTPYNRYETNVYIYWDHSDKAAAPSNVSFTLDAASGQMVLTGADSSMEYRLKSGTSSSWQPCTDAPMYFDRVTSGDTAYYVRYADDGTGESQTKEIILPAKRTSPSAAYSTTTELITGLTTSMEISFDDAAFSPVTVSTMDMADRVDSIPAGSTMTVGIRSKGTATAQPSATKVFTLYPRGEMPMNIVFNPVTNTLSGYTTTMQYRLDTDTAWKSLSGTTLSLASYAKTDRDVMGSVRLKPTTTAAASLSMDFVIPQLVSAPGGTLDYANKKITGLTNGSYQYGTNGTSWSSLTITDGTWDIASRISSSAKTLYLRKAATDTTPISAYTTFEIPARITAPSTPAFLYNDSNYPGRAVLTGATAAMEYKKSTDTLWTAVPASGDLVFDIPTAAATYYIRTQATDTAFCSANKTVTLAKNGTAPSCAYSTSTEIITALKDTMEMKIGNGSYALIGAGITTYDMSNMVNNLSSGSTLTVNVRTKATATAPASADKVFTLYSRGAKPTSVVFTVATTALSGYTTAMEYRLDTASTWTALSGSSLNLQASAKMDRDVIVYVRLKPTSTAAASLPVSFTIPQLVSAPTGTINYTNETITGLANGNYQYGTNGTTWTAVTVTDGAWNISSQISSSAKTLYLRKAATGTTPISAYTTFAIPARPAAPSTPAFVYNDTNNPDQVVLNGLTTEMQYKKSTDTQWIEVTANGILFDPQTAATTYQVRTIAADGRWLSAVKSLTLAARSATPTSTYNATTETLSGLGTTMEISFNGGAYIPLTATTYNLTTLINDIPSGDSLEIKVRRKATSTAPASLDKIFVIEAREASAASVEIVELLTLPEALTEAEMETVFTPVEISEDANRSEGSAPVETSAETEMSEEDASAGTLDDSE